MNVLVLCTGNSCRSQIAEGYLRALGGDQVMAKSAGVEIHGLNPLAAAVMREDGIDIYSHTSNHVDEYRDVSFDYVITVCDNARETCPYFPSQAELLHHNFPDPAQAKGTEQQVLSEFRRVRDLIKQYIRDFLDSRLIQQDPRIAKPVTIRYLEMTNPKDLQVSSRTNPDLEVREAQLDLPDLNKVFYLGVGGSWQWNEKTAWSDDQWANHVNRQELKTYVGYLKGTPIGYFELELHAKRELQILYFGLLPQFIGQGLGGVFLSKAIEICWSYPVDRIWVHTCNLDHPTALGNYLSRGFKEYKIEQRDSSPVTGMGPSSIPPISN